MFLTSTIRDEDGQAVGVLVLQAKTFASGKVGWFGQSKVLIDGQHYQAQVQVVKIGPGQQVGKEGEA
jgi:hypothetical protein